MKTKEEAETKLPDNIEYIEYNGYLKTSYLSCKKCGYKSDDWHIIPRNASKNTKCPGCGECKSSPSIGACQRHIPNNIVIKDFVNIYSRATYQCELCKYEGTVVLRNLRSVLKCKGCKNEGKTKFEIKNEELMKATNDVIHFTRYEGTLNKSGLKCTRCGHTWEARIKTINQYITCPDCKYQCIDEKEFKNLLYENQLSFDMPQNEKQKVNAYCYSCEEYFETSILNIKNGKCCTFCEDEHPVNNKFRCQKFEQIHKKYISLEIHDREAAEIKNEQEIKVAIKNGTTFIWSCNNDHITIDKLSNIKKSFREFGNEKWCYDCRNVVLYSDMKERAKRKEWRLIIENKKEKDFPILSIETHKWVCKNGHVVYETYHQFNARKGCKECPDKILMKAKNGLEKRLEKEDKMKRRAEKEEEIEEFEEYKKDDDICVDDF